MKKTNAKLIEFKKDKYLVAPDIIFYNKELCPTSKIVMIYLISHNYDKGFKLSITDVIKKCNISKSTYNRISKKLQDLGYLRVDTQTNINGFKVNFYTISVYGNLNNKSKEHEVGIEDKVTKDVKQVVKQDVFQIKVNGNYKRPSMNSKWILDEYNLDTILDNINEMKNSDTILYHYLSDYFENNTSEFQSNPTVEYQKIFDDVLDIKKNLKTEVENMYKHESPLYLSDSNFKEVRDDIYDGNYSVEDIKIKAEQGCKSLFHKKIRDNNNKLKQINRGNEN